MKRKALPGDYLYHGSPFRLEVLRPQQAHDTGFAAGCQRAVYATDDLDMAICFALGVEGGEEGERIMLPQYGKKMVFRNCRPRYGKTGYVYVLSKADFVHAMGSQWVAYREQVPLQVLEIPVDEYAAEYCIVEP